MTVYAAGALLWREVETEMLEAAARLQNRGEARPAATGLGAGRAEPGQTESAGSARVQISSTASLFSAPSAAEIDRAGVELRDGEVVFQSQRIALYEDALATLRARGLAYDCACSRAELQRAASAPLGAEAVYPGTCRGALVPAGADRKSVV